MFGYPPAERGEILSNLEGRKGVVKRIHEASVSSDICQPQAGNLMFVTPPTPLIERIGTAVPRRSPGYPKSRYSSAAETRRTL